MIKSMTGYGQGRATSGDGIFTVQIQAVNRKYLEISVHLDREFMELEGPVRQRVGKHIHRGRVQVFVKHELPAEQHSRVVLNRRLAKEYLSAYRQLQREFHLKGQVDLRTVVSSRNVVEVLETHPDKQKIVPLMFRALDRAIQKLDAMRVTEGRALGRDLHRRLRLLRREVAGVRKHAPSRRRENEKRWRDRLKEILEQNDSGRLDREIAQLANKGDISEELVRLDSHVAQFGQILGGPGPKGKPLDFLVQEMVRETNTIGSKANDLGIARRIITIKAELEKIREQVQNIE